MMIGTITTKHIVAHPFILIGLLGLTGYARLLMRCLDGQRHCFLEALSK